MGYKVSLTKLARKDIREYAKFIDVERSSPEAADRWLNGIQREIAKLKDLAGAFNLIPEDLAQGIEYRSFQYHSHRIIHKMDESRKTAQVIRVLHGARRPLEPGDF